MLSSSPPVETTKNIYTVTRLNHEARQILEGSFPSLWVEGEISNFIAHNSGHWYFSLKDAQAQVRCAFFRGQNRRLRFQPKNGMQVKVHASISLYEARGDFQLIVEHMEEAGEGKLRKAFEELKKKLAAEGLFDPAHKKNLPDIPRCIGVVTSPTGAAIRDIISVLNRRFPCVPVIIYPTLVQGDTAAPGIVKALQTANRRRECDVLILARGGGSLEDLWPFNEEIVARAIFQSELPTISGVGHEIDFTIADFVADKRAPTPTGAAELATPDRAELWETLQRDKRHLLKQMHSTLAPLQQQLTWIQKQLQRQHPQHQLVEKTQQLDLYEATLLRLHHKMLQDKKATLETLHARLLGCTPRHRIHHQLETLHRHQDHFKTAILQILHHHRLATSNAAATLDALSPLKTLERGYAIAARDKDRKILKSIKEVQLGDRVNLRLQDGVLDCQVEKIGK